LPTQRWIDGRRYQKDFTGMTWHAPIASLMSSMPFTARAIFENPCGFPLIRLISVQLQWNGDGIAPHSGPHSFPQRLVTGEIRLNWPHIGLSISKHANKQLQVHRRRYANWSAN
jgi:hypothetical protein